jgi:dihydropteroate synthase
VQNTAFSTNKTLNINGNVLMLDRPKIMAIINVTPDSFYAGSRFETESEILNQVEKVLKEGASILDVGGYSSRPKAKDIPLEEEKSRVGNAIKSIVKNFPNALISIDTFRSEIAQVGVDEGAGMVNDVSGGNLDEAMFATIAKLNVPYVLMHMRGTPQTMTAHTNYQNLVVDIIEDLQQKIFQLRQLGVKDIIIDPGFGFAKTREQNFELLNKLEVFQIFKTPVMIGLSRKSMIWKTLEIKPEEALNGSTALHAIAAMKDASLFRVHDVKECNEVLKLVDMVKSSSAGWHMSSTK